MLESCETEVSPRSISVTAASLETNLTPRSLVVTPVSHEMEPTPRSLVTSQSHGRESTPISLVTLLSRERELTPRPLVTSLSHERESTPLSLVTSVSLFSSPPALSDSDEYETDLEEECPEQIVRAPDEDPRVGQMTYSYACLDIGVPQQTLVSDNLSTHTLCLAHRSLGSTAIRALTKALRKNVHVRELDLTANDLGPLGMQFVATSLAENDVLTNLNVSRNHIGPRGAIYVGELIRINRGITHLDISWNDLDEESGRYIAPGIESNDTIVDLNMSHNELQSQGTQYIAGALALNIGIQKLDISWNHIRLDGGVSLCKGLQSNETITELDISWNGFGYEGALALGTLLKVNCTLHALDASHNRINWEGAVLLAEGLKENTSLHTIKLVGNPLTTTGCLDILDAVARESSGVRMLDMKGIPVTPEFDMMAAALKLSRQFDYRHGEIVPTHDVLGERHEKRIAPIQRVIDYMQEKQIRPTELFRSFDKDVNKKLTSRDFSYRMRGTGYSFQRYEMRQLLESILSESEDPNATTMDYSMLASSVQRQIEKERNQKIAEREKQKRLEQYHKKILNTELPPIDDCPIRGSSRATTSLQSLADGAAGSIGHPQVRKLLESESVASFGSVRATEPSWRPGFRSDTPKLMSMSTSLGSKFKAFGTADVQKKKKKKKRNRNKNAKH